MGRYLSPRYGQVILVNGYLFVELSNNGFSSYLSNRSQTADGTNVLYVHWHLIVSAELHSL